MFGLFTKKPSELPKGKAAPPPKALASVKASVPSKSTSASKGIPKQSNIPTKTIPALKAKQKSVVSKKPTPVTKPPQKSSSDEGDSESSKSAPRDPNSVPRKRPPGPPPCNSLAEVVAETERVPVPLEEDALMARRDSMVRTDPISKGLPFDEIRTRIPPLHPSIIPRSPRAEDASPLISALIDDPVRVGELHHVDQIIETRQFIDAMRKSLTHSPKKSPSTTNMFKQRRLNPRPISPMQENVTSVAFLPAPHRICVYCGLYLHACVCPTSPVRKNLVLPRPLDKRKSPNLSSPGSEDEGTINSIYVSKVSLVNSDRLTKESSLIN